MAHVANSAIKEDVIDFELTKNKLIRNSGLRLIGQGDNLGDVFGVRIFQDGVAFDLAGYSVQGYFIRQNGTTVLINGSAVNGNVAIVTLPQACYVYDGPFSLAIKIVGTITETLRVIDGVVTKTTTETMIDPGSVVPDISQLLAKIQQMEQATAAANTAATNANNVATNIIAPAYSTSSTYKVGNYCIYNGYLYRCTTAITTAEEWTAAHWVSVKLGDDVADLKRALNDTNRAGKIPFDVHENTVLTTNGEEIYNAVIRVVYFDITNTGVYFIHNCNRKGLAATSYAGYDSNGDYVSDGITIGQRDFSHSFAIIPASGVKKVGISMWNVGYSHQGFVVNEEPYITQVTAFDFNANIAQCSEYPFVSNIFNQLFSLRGVEWTGSSFITSNDEIANYGFIPVNSGDTLQITFTGTENNYGAFASFIYYFASDFSFISSAKYETGVFTVPANAKYVSIMYFWVDNDKCVIKHIKAIAPDIKIDERSLPAISSTDYNAYPLYVNIANDVLEVTYKYGNGYDMTVQMQKQGGLDENDNPVGGNQLFDFCRWFKTANSSRVITNSPDKTSFYNINGTDYFGPYRVRAVNNADGDKAANDDFTGGNHQYNNSGAGSTATARTASIVFSVDGKVVTNFAGYAKTVQVDWINYVQGNNTKKADGTGREILTEHYTVYFDGDKFKVKNVIEALEEIYIYTYYGMQSKQMYAGSSGAYAIDPLYYLGSKANRERQPRNTVTSAEDKYCREMLYVGRNDVLDMFMDDVGLGDFALATEDPVSAFSSTGKLYFNLINATNASGGLTLNTKDVIYYTGWYQFRPKLV